MNIGDIFALLQKYGPLLPQIEPLLPDIVKMIATVQRLEADADVKAAMMTGEKLAQIFSQQGLKE